MAMRQFKAESKKLLDLMINSIYTNREIFLRELISNASDACDKLYFKSLTDTSINVKKEDLHIHIAADKENRTLTISDNGIGMTKDELEKNLGTIARSGSQDFKATNQNENIDIIGQFGVGFYSAFMVATKSALLEHLDTVGVNLDVFKPARTFILEQQSVVVHARHPHGLAQTTSNSSF